MITDNYINCLLSDNLLVVVSMATCFNDTDSHRARGLLYVIILKGHIIMFISASQLS